MYVLLHSLCKTIIKDMSEFSPCSFVWCVLVLFILSVLIIIIYCDDAVFMQPGLSCVCVCVLKNVTCLVKNSGVFAHLVRFILVAVKAVNRTQVRAKQQDQVRQKTWVSQVDLFVV